MKCFAPTQEIVRFLDNDCACAGNIIFQAERVSKYDDDCACVSGSSQRSSITNSGTSHWRVTPGILRFPLPSGQFQISNPSGDGIIALLSQEEFHLFSAFDSPRLLDLLNDYVPGLSNEQAKALTKQWIKLGLLTHTGDDCACVTSEINCGTVNLASPLTAWLHLTERCNLRCDYCYLPHVCEDMSIGTGRAAVDVVFRSALANGFKQVKLKYAGGEPLLRFPLIVELHQYAQSLAQQHALELSGVVLSNGTLLTTEKVRTLISLGLRLMISLDGLGNYNDQHRRYAGGRGSAADVVEAVDLALVHGLTPNISVTVSSRTVNGLPGVVAWILEHDLPFSLNFYRENELSIRHKNLRLDEQKIIQGMSAAFKVIENNLPRHSFLGGLVDRANLSVAHTYTCGVGQNYLVFDQNGRIANCQMRIREPISDMHAADPLAVIRADQHGIQNISVEEKEGCKACEWKYWCTGGCPLATYRATGRYDVKSPNCQIYKALFPEALRLEGLRLLKFQDNPEVVTVL